MNRLPFPSRASKALAYVAVPLLLTLALAYCPAYAAQGEAGYSAAALYNQANAFAREGKPGSAILSYERARLLVPGDSDVAANEAFVRTKAGLPDRPGNRFAYLFSFASPNAFAWLGGIGLLLTGAGAMMRFFPQRRGLRAATTGAGLVLILFVVGNAVFTWPKMQEAVVIAQASGLRVSPASVAQAPFKLREGEIVTVSAEGPEFELVQATEGRSGWVARTDIAPVVP